MLSQREIQALVELLDRVKLSTAEMLFIQAVLGRENQLAQQVEVTHEAGRSPS